MDFYIYFIQDPRKPNFVKSGYELPFEPFYIGKGCRDRYKLWGKTRNRWYQYKIKSIKSKNIQPYVTKIGNFSENEAIRLEQHFIKIFGRKDKKEGPLLNLTDGGDGGRLGHIVSSETKEKIRQAHLGKKHWWTNSPNLGKKFPHLAGENNPACRPEIRQKNREWHLKHNAGGTFWVNNNKENLRINPSELNFYIQNGYKRGMKK